MERKIFSGTLFFDIFSTNSASWFVLFNRKKYLRLFQSRKAVPFSPWNTGHPLAPWRDSWRLDASETRPEFPGGFLETMSVNDTASICSCLNLRDRCTYRSTVILMEEWPNISLSAGILTLDSTQRVAKVWRSAWKWISRIPVSFRIRLNRFAIVRGSTGFAVPDSR